MLDRAGARAPARPRCESCLSLHSRLVVAHLFLLLPPLLLLPFLRLLRALGSWPPVQTHTWKIRARGCISRRYHRTRIFVAPRDDANVIVDTRARARESLESPFFLLCCFFDFSYFLTKKRPHIPYVGLCVAGERVFYRVINQSRCESRLFFIAKSMLCTT